MYTAGTPALAVLLGLRELLMARSGWEKGILAIAAALIASVIIGAIVLVASNAGGGGGENKQVTTGGSRATPTVAARAPTPTAVVIAIATLPTAGPTDRADCNAIRGTDYTSESERQFFAQNCVTPTGGQGSQPTQPPRPQPTQPPPSGGFTAGDAINVTVYWMTHNASQAYTTNAGSCNAVQTGSHWVVTCNANLAGCQGSVCATTVSACVFSDPLEVRPSDQC
jgi:hypothetical protein